MKKGIILVCAVFVALSGLSQKDPVLMTVGGSKVTKSEFEQIFFKNYKKDEVTKEDLDEYMDLFVKFKLKVAEAESRGMDTAESFVGELDGYRRQLVKPYMVDKNMSEALVQEAYDRSLKEVRASHIMIKVSKNDPPEDTLKAYNKAMKIRERIVGGEDFETVARSKQGSEDPSVVDNGGDLGFFSVFEMVYPFENAVYNMKVGEVSKPVRTRYGYHIIKKTDEREARGVIQVAHIMIQTTKNASEAVELEPKNKIEEVYTLLEQGESFEELAKKYSDDRRSAQKGGVLPRFGTGIRDRMVPEFEDVAFNLKEDGSYSEPFQTEFGWHIVKRLDYQPMGSYEDMKGFLEPKVKRDVRSNKSKAAFINKLKKEYKFKDYSKKRLPAIVESLDSTIFLGEWSAEKVENKSKPLFKFAGKKYTVGDFANFLEASQRREREISLDAYVHNKYVSYTTNELSAYEESRLDEKYPDFAALMKEYRDGILLFEITDQMVWSKAQKDSAGLADFYADHRDEFMWGNRVKCQIYKCNSQDVAVQVKAMLDTNALRADIIKVVNADSPLNVKVEAGIFETDTRGFLKNVNKGISQVIPYESSFYVVRVDEMFDPMPKTIDEARGPIVSAYQDHLEKQWIEELKNKYPVTINKEVLYSVQKN